MGPTRLRPRPSSTNAYIIRSVRGTVSCQLSFGSLLLTQSTSFVSCFLNLLLCLVISDVALPPRDQLTSGPECCIRDPRRIFSTVNTTAVTKSTTIFHWVLPVITLCVWYCISHGSLHLPSPCCIMQPVSPTFGLMGFEGEGPSGAGFSTSVKALTLSQQSIYMSQFRESKTTIVSSIAAQGSLPFVMQEDMEFLHTVYMGLVGSLGSLTYKTRDGAMLDKDDTYVTV
jgi:hypothetical protein